MNATWTIAGATLANGVTTDLHVSDGVFVESAPSGAQKIDAQGLVALPGLVDLHTHLREPGGEEAETIATGTAAAARGGFTATFAMANTSPVTDTPDRVENVRRLAEGASTEVVPIGAVTAALKGGELSDITGMAERTGVRVFSDDGFSVPTARLVREAMELIKPFDGVLAEHCQDPTLAGPGACCDEGPVSRDLGHEGWPGIAESVIIARDVQIAKYLDARLHLCHISTAEGVEIVRWAKQRGVRVTAEVMPHHLLLTSEELRSGETTYKVNPPLRSAEDVEACRQALAEGTIDIVATDHAPHRKQDKDKPFPEAKPGMVAIEHVLSVVIETMINQGRLSWSGLADRMSHRPAQIGRLAHQGRPVAVGEPANLVLVDPAARSLVDREQALSKGRNNPYHGRDLPDPVVATFWRGRQTFSR